MSILFYILTGVAIITGIYLIIDEIIIRIRMKRLVAAYFFGTIKGVKIDILQ